MNNKKLLSLLFLLHCISTLAQGGSSKWSVNKIAHDVRNVYLATDGKGLVVIDRMDGSQTFCNVANGQLEYDATRTVVAHDGAAVVATNPGVVIDIPIYHGETDGESGCWITVLKNGEMVSTQNLMDISVDAPFDGPGATRVLDFFSPFTLLSFDGHGQMWGAMWGGALVKIDGTASACVDWFGDAPGIAMGQHIRAMAFDSDNTLWICYSSPGVFYRMPEGGKIEPVLTQADVYGHGNSIAIDEEGNKWIATDKGLVRYGRDGEARLYATGGSLNCVMLDGEQRPWVLPAYGDLQCLEDDGTFTAYKCPYPTGYQRYIDTVGDTIYMAATEGLYTFCNGIFTPVAIPATGRETGITNFQPSHTTNQCFDLQGRRLSTRPEQGLYIEGGRKRVVR